MTHSVFHANARIPHFAAVTAGERADGHPCYFEGSVSATAPHVGDVACPNRNALAEGPAFPSRARPIIDFSAYPLDGSTGERTLQTFLGVAADKIATIAIVDNHGQRHAVKVANNVFYSPNVAGVRAKKLVGMDSDGSVVFEADR